MAAMARVLRTSWFVANDCSALAVVVAAADAHRRLGNAAHLPPIDPIPSPVENDALRRRTARTKS
jgi:hypothetical protein